MSTPSLLSICIPTFNRADTLRSCLFMLCSQVAQRPEAIEVVVCDNASTDHTASLLADVHEVWPFVRYERNTTNIGMLRNIDRVVRHASGEFCWLFGDDDIALPYALDVILEMIEGIPDRSRFAFGCTNAFMLDPAGREIRSSTDRHCSLPSTVLDPGAEIFAHLDYGSLGHISRLIVNRERWVTENYDARRPFEVYSFLRVLIRMTKGASTFYLDAPVVGARNKHSVSYYTNHIPLASTIEFPEYDRLCLDELGLPRRRLLPLMKSRRRLTIRAALKMLVFQSEYAPYLEHLRRPQFALRSERIAVRVLYLLLANRPWARWPRAAWERRQTNPVSADRSLHSSV